MTDAAATAPDATDPGETPRRRGGKLLVGAAVFSVLTLALTIAAYRFGEGAVVINDRTISEMTFFEVTGASAVGVAGLALGLSAAALAVVAALIAAIVSVAIAVLGVGLGLFVTLGVVTGPILLAVMIGVLIKRRYHPDVI